MFLELINLNALPIEQYSVKSQKALQTKNGKIIKDVELTEYEKDGDIILEGHYNDKPIYYKNRKTPKFRNKNIRFINNIDNPNNGIIRTLTPFINSFTTELVKEPSHIVKYPSISMNGDVEGSRMIQYIEPSKKQTLKSKIKLIEKISKKMKKNRSTKRKSKRSRRNL